MVNKLLSGNLGANIPFKICKILGLVTTAVITNEKLINNTNVTSAFSKNL